MISRPFPLASLARKSDVSLTVSDPVAEPVASSVSAEDSVEALDEPSSPGVGNSTTPGTKERLAYIVTRAHHGGAQGHVAALIDHFRHHYDVYLATGEEGYLTERAREWGVPVSILRHMTPALSPREIVNDARAFWEIWRWLGSIRPAILHAHSSKAGGLGRCAAILRRVPTVFTAHGWGFTDGVPFAQRVVMLPAEWLAARATDAVITVSRADYELARRHRVRPRVRMVPIHNGISKDAPQSVPIADGTVRLVCVARFSPQKSQALLVRALEEIDEPWHLSFVGDGPLEDEVRQMAADRGLKGRVEFLGARDDVDGILARSHVFVLPSNWEGFPLTILEAMRAGLPVIASDVGGVREAVVDGVTGYLVARDDVHALAGRLRRLICEHGLRAKLGRQARDMFLSEFVDTKMFDKVQAVYSALAGSSRRRPAAATGTASAR
ncbi:MAG: glycosyltransferase family 4 protein [Gemmatimonadales bacterium]|jgi:glycosyltransferase involved in cell wall biosynthesis